MLSYFFELEVCNTLATKAPAPPPLKEPLAASSSKIATIICFTLLRLQLYDRCCSSDGSKRDCFWALPTNEARSVEHLLKPVSGESAQTVPRSAPKKKR